MGKAHSRRGASAAPAAKPSRKRRRGKHARAKFPASPPCGPRLELRSVQAEPARPVRPHPRVHPSDGSSTGAGGDPKPKSRILAFAGVSGEWIDLGEPIPSPNRTHRPGPSLRQDIPRPPLRLPALRARRRGAFVWQLSRDRVRRGVARTAAFIVARLDAYLWQPAVWPFRPAQREMLARTLAVLSLAAVAAGWIAMYSALAPTHVAHAPAPPPAPPKPFTARAVSHALRPVTLPKAKAPALRPPHW